MGDFNRSTRQAILRQPTLTLSDGGTFSFDLPQVGYVGALILKFSGTVNTAAASSTTQAATVYPPPPFGYIKNIKVSTNEGADIWNTSGWGAYLQNATTRTGFDQAVSHLDFLQSGTVDPFGRYFSNVGALGASASGNWSFTVRLPLAWGDANLTGLLLAQNTGIRFTVSIQTGNITTVNDMFSATTGTVTHTNVVCVPTVELYHLPADPQDDPDLAFAHTVIEDIQSFTATGDFVYRPILGNIYTKFIQEIVSSAAPVSPANVTALKLTYAQSQTIYNEDADTHLFLQRYRYDRDLPAGVYAHDYQLGNGWPELPSSRDAFDTAKLTDMQLTTTLTGFTPTNAFVRTIREQLVPISG